MPHAQHLSYPGSHTSADLSPPRASARGSLRTFADRNTGRTIRQLTDLPTGGFVGYFRHPRHVPGGFILIETGHPAYSFALLHPDSGDLRPLHGIHHYLKLSTATGILYFLTYDRTTGQPKSVNSIQLPDGKATLVADLPEKLPGRINDITCDGRHLILSLGINDAPSPLPTSLNVSDFWQYILRPRHGAMWTHDLHTNKTTLVLETTGVTPFHQDTHYTDPTLFRYALDNWEGDHQRVFSMRVDGSDIRPLPPQKRGELVTHEWWWPGGKLMGFTFQDRRNDPSAYLKPWCEYAECPTQLGVCDLNGKITYLSDPVNHYHTHLYTSQDGNYLVGEGTDGHSFAYAAKFSFNSTKIDYIPLATIDTPYVPFRGQQVHTELSADNRWLLFNNLVGSHHQVFAVEVDF